MISRRIVLLCIIFQLWLSCRAINWNTEIFPMATMMTSLGNLIQPKPYNIQKSINHAKELYQNNEIDMDNADKLAVMIVFNYPLSIKGTHPRIGSLVCALNKIYQNIAPETPIDIYVWFNSTSIPFIPKWFLKTFPLLRIMPIDIDSWQLHEDEFSPFPQWTYGSTYSLNYHLMGHWRLTFAFDFIKHMNYQYMLQIDDDTFIIENINYNIVQKFSQNNLAYVYRNRLLQEEHVAVLGLAEIVKFWMVTRNYLHPQGPLYSHFRTNTLNNIENIDNIHSASWDRHIVGASFMLFDVDFWYCTAVQDFLELVYSTGAHLTQRWLEQGLINMIHLLFLSSEHVYVFPQLVAVHQKVCDASIFRLLECDRVVLPAVPVPIVDAVHIGSVDMGPGYSGSMPVLTLSGIDMPTASSTIDASSSRGSSSDSSSGSSSSTNSTIDSSSSSSTSSTIDASSISSSSVDNINTIEFLVLWQLHTVRENTEELTLFKWKYNTNLASCGADTAILNDYLQYKDTRDTLLILPHLWVQYKMDSKLNTLLSYNPIVINSLTAVAAEQCRIVLLQQLYDYIEFYTLSMGATSVYENRLQYMYDTILSQADRLFNAPFPLE